MKAHILVLALTILIIFSGCERRSPVVVEEIIIEIPEEIEEIDIDVPATIEEREEIIEPRYGFTEEDILHLAQLLCGDESYNGDGEYDFVYGALHDDMNYCEMSKILCVVMNRVRNDMFPDTVSEVLFQKGQFADYRRINTEPADIAIEKISEWCEAYDQWDPGIQTIPEEHLYFEAGPNLTNITGESW